MIGQPASIAHFYLDALFSQVTWRSVRDISDDKSVAHRFDGTVDGDNSSSAFGRNVQIVSDGTSCNFQNLIWKKWKIWEKDQIKAGLKNRTFNYQKHMITGLLLVCYSSQLRMLQAWVRIQAKAIITTTIIFQPLFVQILRWLYHRWMAIKVSYRIWTTCMAKRVWGFRVEVRLELIPCCRRPWVGSYWSVSTV